MSDAELDRKIATEVKKAQFAADMFCNAIQTYQMNTSYWQLDYEFFRRIGCYALAQCELILEAAEKSAPMDIEYHNELKESIPNHISKIKEVISSQKQKEACH